MSEWSEARRQWQQERHFISTARFRESIATIETLFRETLPEREARERRREVPTILERTSR